MRPQTIPPTPQASFRRLPALLVAGACLLQTWALPAALAETAPTNAPPAKASPASPTLAKATSIQGTCLFGGKQSTWSAKLKAKGDGSYDAVYVSSWGGKPLDYVGTLKTDGKTSISGSGKASGGRANGSFEFSGTYGADGTAQCNYWEVGGRRKGTMTAEQPK